MRRSLITLGVLLWSLSAAAITLDVPLSDPVKEAQAQEIFHALRCVVCEGQSLAESNAVLAVQMRAHVRTMLAEQQSEEAILTFFRSRYGDQIVMEPPFSLRTLLLWMGPLLLLGVGGWLVWRRTDSTGEA